MIDEVPIENSDQPVEVEEEHVVVDVPVVEPKKQRGRPKGTVKPKKEEPKAKVKPKKIPKPKKIQYASEESEEEEIVPPVFDTRAIASEVISMLSNRHMDRSNQKREKYRSWFDNPQY